MKTSQRGRLGEDQALVFLTEQGQELLERNYRTRRGEIDLITRNDRRLHFVEVKNWRLPMENLEYAVDWRKQRRIWMSARDFLSRNEKYAEFEKQFDVVYLDRNQSVIRYIPHAFEGGAR